MNNTLLDRIRYHILEAIGTRDELRTHLGGYDFDVERGWWVGKTWFSYDEPKSIIGDIKCLIFGGGYCD